MYKNSDLFMKDLNKIHDRVKKATGLSIKQFRFAGGSSNGFVSDKVFKEILVKLKKEGYNYYDWNCSSADASGIKVKKSKIVRSSTKCKDKSINLLMHDAIAKTTTVEALPQIIEHYQSRGYVFDVIDENSFQVKHRTK